MAKGAYIGINTNIPVYQETTVNVTSSNITTVFSVSNSTYYFQVVSGNTGLFKSNNKGITSSTAQTVLTAKYDMDVSFSYRYSTEQNYDKFTLVVGSTTVENRVSGSTQIKNYSGKLKKGESITFKYEKDSSQDGNEDECSYYNIKVVYQKQTSSVMKEVARKINNIYIGVNGKSRKIAKAYIGVNGKARLFFSGGPSPEGSTLNDCSWENISEVSQAGLAENYWSVGDCKEITLNGSIISDYIYSATNLKYYVFILGFDHNYEIEGRGITFGCFKDINNKADVCITDRNYGGFDGSGFKINNPNITCLGWNSSDMRSNILASTNKDDTGNTFMHMLPQDLKNVMKLMTKYSDNSCVYADASWWADSMTATQDYLTLLSVYEIFGDSFETYPYLPPCEVEKDWQKQYQYYKNGNSKRKKRDEGSGAYGDFWLRSQAYGQGDGYFSTVNTSGVNYGSYQRWNRGLAPIFLV